MTWIPGDVSGSTTLTSSDHIYAAHINELRARAGAQVFNVKDYGALGNGTTDDTAAIQSAIDAVAANGGKVLIPGGTDSGVHERRCRQTSNHTGRGSFWDYVNYHDLCFCLIYSGYARR